MINIKNKEPEVCSLMVVDMNGRVCYETHLQEGLYNACPNNHGDWYFTGNYPTPGGNRVANKAFMNYMERKEGRGY